MNVAIDKVVLVADLLDSWTRSLIVVLMMIIAAVVVSNVFFRYILNVSIVWSEELSVYLLVWCSFLASSVAFRRGLHVAFTVFRDRLPQPLGRHVELFNHVVVLAFLAVMTWYGAELAISNWNQQTPALRISKAIPYLAVPVGGVLMLIQVVRLLVLPTDSPPRPGTSRNATP